MKIRTLWKKFLSRIRQARWDFVLAISGIIVTLLTTILAIILDPIVTKAFLRAVYEFSRKNWLMGCGAIIVLVLMVDDVKKRWKLRALGQEGPCKFKRFEKIDKIVYGHIDYYPLIHYSAGNDAPKGIGIRLIEEIFEKRVVKKYKNKVGWNDLVSKLSEGVYDIVATPLYETRERSRVVSFCTPLFFSDIGIYVKHDSQLFEGRRPSNQSFEQVMELLSRLKDVLKLTAIDGELSGKMILKHLKIRREKVTWLSRDESTVAGLIGAVEDDEMPSDVVFAEVFQASQTEAVKSGSVINLLTPKQLLYPVSFAVRKQEYVLKNFINLKLAEIDEKYDEGILGFILKELKEHPDFKLFDMPQVKQYFVRGKTFGYPVVVENKSRPVLRINDRDERGR
jgi:ABC-type amino acid transport substrate-binding protein